MKDRKSEIRELQYALEVADGVVRCSDEWLPTLSSRERSLAVALLRKVSVAVRQAERTAETDPTQAVAHATDLVDALVRCGEAFGSSSDHALGDLFGDAAEQVRAASNDLVAAV